MLNYLELIVRSVLLVIVLFILGICAAVYTLFRPLLSLNGLELCILGICTCCFTYFIFIRCLLKEIITINTLSLVTIILAVSVMILTHFVFKLWSKET